MTDLTRVPGPSSPLEGRTAKVLALIAVSVLVAIAKPWGGLGPAPAAQATVPPSPSTAPAATTSSFDPLALYEVFGIHEPAPDWELWPAGFLVSFGFAMRIDGTPSGSAEPSSTPSAGPRPSGSPQPGQPGANVPVWPAAIKVTAGSHLSMIGINTPLGFTISGFRLSRVDADGGSTTVTTVRLRSRWPSHFTVIGMDDGSGREALESWPPGRYRLELDIDPGGVVRTVEIGIDAPPGDRGPASAAPVQSPGGG
jgi:hypothetical protein